MMIACFGKNDLQLCNSAYLIEMRLWKTRHESGFDNDLD